MGSDKARRSYDASRMYRSVVSQQGRVTLEADANEGEEIRADEARADLIDVIGPLGAPAEGFRISALPGNDLSDFAIGAGALYVGGMRVVNPDPQATYKGQWRAKGNGYPAEWIDYPHGRVSAEPTHKPANELIYLSLVEREVSAVEDRALLEPAIGGPDTAARTRLVQRVQRYSVPEGFGCGPAFADLFAAAYRRYAELNHATRQLTSLARLRADFVPTSDGPDPCQPTAQPGFLGADNQLIRVQVSEPAEGEKAPFFLWGWDNASFIYRVTIPKAGSQTMTLQGIPVDVSHEPRRGQWVELLAAAVDLGGDAYVASETGRAYKVAGYDTRTRLLTLEDPISSKFVVDPQRPAFIRIWENRLPFAPDDTTAVDLVADDGKGTTTGNGVRIFSGASEWVPGDFWMIGVRPTTPTDVLPARLKTSQPPDGPRRWLAPLAVIDWLVEGAPAVSDCRPSFLNLVDLTKRPVGEGGGACCEVVVAVGEDIQAAIDSLPADGGAVCLKAGTHHTDGPIHIRRSSVTLRGESGGTIIQLAIAAAAAADVVLNIDAGPEGDPEQRFKDVAVRDIAFVATGSPGGWAFIAITDCTRAQVRGCRFTLELDDQPAASFLGILAADCRDLTIADNSFDGVSDGIDVQRPSGLAAVLRNTITLNAPLVGTAIALRDGRDGVRARVAENRIESCVFGVLLTSGLAGTTIEANTITTNPAGDTRPFPLPDQMASDLPDYLRNRSYAIKCEADLCTIRRNRINLLSSHWGGISAFSESTVIEANLIVSSAIAEESGLPVGIYCTVPDDGVAGGLRVYDNVLTGRQAGIAVFGCNELEVSRNRIDGASTAPYAVYLVNVTGGLIRGNDVVQMSTELGRSAIFAGDGDRNRFDDNHIDGCMLAIDLRNQIDVDVVGNRIEGANVSGIRVAGLSRTATICDNRLSDCGSAPEPLQPGMIDVTGLGVDANLRIAGCEIVDYGMPAVVGSVAKRVLGIQARNVRGCQLVGNRVGYTNLEALDVNQMQFRQPLVLDSQLHGDTPVGVALISDNDLAGTSLGQFISVQLIEKITFNNNICRQRTRADGASPPTVELQGQQVIAMGNHVVADSAKVPSIEVARAAHTIFLGNATTGDLVPPSPATVVPVPYPNFNVKV